MIMKGRSLLDETETGTGKFVSGVECDNKVN